MVTTNNKQENMVNNEQENYTGEPQEEGFFAKNKSIVIGIFGLLALAGLWAVSNSGKESAAPAPTKENTSSIKDFFNKIWGYGENEKPSWTQLAILTGGAAGATWLAKRSKTIKRIKDWLNEAKNKFSKKPAGQGAVE